MDRGWALPDHQSKSHWISPSGYHGNPLSRSSDGDHVTLRADTVGNSKLVPADIAIICLYFVLILFIGLWSSRQNRGSVGGYFLAGRNMHWVPVGASLFASNVGSLHFVGLAGSGAAAGIGTALYEINAIYVILMLGWLFLPVYISSGIYTMPEYMRKRFGRQRIRIYLAVLSLLLYIFTKISADLFAGAIFIEQALGWNIYAAITLLLAIAALFTITGGLTAVIWTDFIQTIIMIFGAVALMALGFIEVGGFEGMRYKYERAVPNDTLYSNSTCGYPRDDYLHLMRDPKTGDIPWPGIFGIFINSIWYWCADQVIVQRTLAAKNFSQAKAGCVLCGYLKFLPMFILVMPGMISRILYTDEVACVDPDICMEVCGNPTGCTNIAYPLLVLNLMPDAARGLMLAVMLSALMSSLTSIFNSSSTVFTIDIWKKIRHQAKDMELMIVGRVCVLVLVGVSIAWVPVIAASQGSQLFVYIQQISSYLTPPVCAIYSLAIFYSRLNEQGAFWGLIVGLVVGCVRFVLEFSYPLPVCGEEDTRPNVLTNFHYLYFGLFLFLFSGLIAILVSCMTAPIDSKHLYRLTFATRHSTKQRVDIDQDSVFESPGVISEVKEAVDDVTKDAKLAKEAVDDVTKDAKLAKEEVDDVTKDEKLAKYSVNDVEGDVLDEDVMSEKGDQANFLTRCGRWVCGIEKMQDGDTPEMTDEQKAALICIDEEPKHKLIGNINAIVLMFFATFLWGFFA